MPFKAVLLDIDGTLVDSNEFHVLSWHQALVAAGMAISHDKIRKQIGKGADMLLPALVPDLPELKRQSIARRHGEIFKKEYLPRVRAFPRACELIQALHDSGRQVVLASSADGTEVSHYAKLLGVEALLAATTSADDVSRSKPAGDIFGSALQKTTSKQPDEALAIGDTPYDVEAAAKCHIRTIALRSGGFSEQELRNAEPIAIYDDVADLLICLSQSPLGSHSA